MYSLAADTGGKALFDNNDLTRGIVQAQHAIADYYIVGYYTTNTAQNGRFRSVKITSTPALDANLDYRQGYYANKEFSRFTAADKERQLEDALMLRRSRSPTLRSRWRSTISSSTAPNTSCPSS